MNNIFKKRTNVTKLQEQLKGLAGGGGFEQQDINEWKLTVDAKTGAGSAVIRFLPPDEDHGMPFVKVINHGFKIGTRWYIKNCPTTKGSTDENFKACPVCEEISSKDLYNTDNRKYGQLKRSTSYWAKIMVVKDPSKPENEGGVFLYRFGVKIMNKISSMLNVDEALGEVPVDVTCAVEGANFTLKAEKVNNQRNYDSSSFTRQAPIPGLFDKSGNIVEAAEADLKAKMAAVDLGALIADDKFESPEELKKAFDRVMGNEKTQEAHKQDQELSEFEDSLNDFDENEDIEMNAPVQTGAKTLSSVDDQLAGILGR